MGAYTSTLFRVELPEGWDGSRDKEGLHTFTGPSDIGALQVSAYRYKERIMDENLLSTTQVPEENHRYLGRLTCGDFTGYQLIYAEEETFWRKLWIAAGDVLLFVTYNCPRTREDDELAAVNGILGTFKRA